MLKFLLLVIAILHSNYATSKPPSFQPRESVSKVLSQKSPRWWQSLPLAALFIGTMAMITPPLEDDAFAQPLAEEKGGWQTVKAVPLAFQRAVFHLKVDAPQLHDFLGAQHILHLAYLGPQRKKNGSLFIAVRLSVFGADNPVGGPLHKADMSLFSHHGLLAEDVKIEEIKVFPTEIESAAGPLDVVLVGIRNIDLRFDFQPVALESFPPPETKLQQLNYWPDEEAAIFTLRQRNCRAGKFDDDTLIAEHSCSSPLVTHSFGAPLFNRETERLVGFYLWLNGKKAGAKAVAISADVLEELDTTYARANIQSLLLEWANLKEAER